VVRKTLSCLNTQGPYQRSLISMVKEEEELGTLSDVGLRKQEGEDDQNGYREEMEKLESSMNAFFLNTLHSKRGPGICSTSKGAEGQAF